MICPFFPPVGGIAVNRSLNIAKNLSLYGYTPIVATLSLADIDKFDFGVDKSKNQEIESFQIIRISSNYPFKLLSLLYKLKLFRLVRFLFYPFFWEREFFWTYKAYEPLKKIIKEEKIDLIYTTSSPFSSLFLGRKLKRSLGIPWVADLRDPFTDGYMYHFPSVLHWKIAKSIEKKILKSPDRLIVTCNTLRQLYIDKGIVAPNKIKTILNGF